MSESSLTCPNCGHEFDLDQAFADRFQEEKRKAVAEAVERARQKAQEDIEAVKNELQQDFEKQFEEQRAELLRLTADKIKEEYDLKLAAKDEQMEGIKRQLDDLKRKAEQGSQQIQGEALENCLEDYLQATFPNDEISEVKKGQSGADITHKVFNRFGQYCGTIIWEAKNTKTWGKDWIEKLKNDKSQSGADVMALVSTALPEHIKTFDLMDGVWVSSYSTAIAMATVLRENMIQVAHLNRALQGQDNKMGEVYAYLTSPKFANRVQRIVEAFQSIDSDIDKERTAMEKIWKARREQLKRVINGTTDMVVDLQTIMGKDLPEIDSLSLPSGS